MQYLIYAIIAISSCLLLVDSYGIGCIRDPYGACVEPCPDGTAEYSSDCFTALSEKTCKNPIAHDMGPICDLSRCDCMSPYIKDTSTGYCVLPQNCPSSESYSSSSSSSEEDPEFVPLHDFYGTFQSAKIKSEAANPKKIIYVLKPDKTEETELKPEKIEIVKIEPEQFESEKSKEIKFEPVEESIWPEADDDKSESDWKKESFEAVEVESGSDDSKSEIIASLDDKSSSDDCY